VSGDVGRSGGTPDDVRLAESAGEDRETDDTTLRVPRGGRPGPRRATEDEDDAPPTSDTIAAHRAARRRAQAGRPEPPRVEPANGAERPTVRAAHVPDAPVVDPFGARAATPVMADRGAVVARHPQPPFDGRRQEQVMRATARARLWLVLAAAGGAVVLAGTVLFALLYLWSP
jgi:hypothetical protein